MSITRVVMFSGGIGSWAAVPYRGKPASDAPRYKAIGNCMAMPVLRWIGQRIAMVENERNK